MGQQKILLLENVAAQAAGVRERLTEAGFQVAVSRYEADGFKRLTEWSPELVLLSTSHPAGDLVEYCRKARALAPSARIVITSSLNRERLFQEHPQLATLVDGVLLRPYSFEEAVRLLRPEGREPAGVPQPAKPRVKRLVAAPDKDPELEARLRWGLEPNGVQVVTLAPAAVEAFCSEERPGVLILEWPLPPELAAEGLARIRAGKGAPAGVLLLAEESREAVSVAAPKLLNLVDMFFRKPVAWEHFFRVLARQLGLPEHSGLKPAAPRPVPRAAPPPDEEGLRAEFQRQMEARFLEVEELKRKLDAATRQAGGPPPEGLETLGAENDRLRQALQEAEKRSSLALAMEHLKRSELEVKLDNLLRMKDEFELRAQDELEARTREGEQLRTELERSLLEKEQLEERLHQLESATPPAAAEAPAPGDPAALEALAAEAARHRALAAEAEVAGADAVAKAAVLEEGLARAETQRERAVAELAQERQLREQAALELRKALERADLAERRIDQLLAERSDLEGRAIGAVAARRSAETALAEALAGRAELEREVSVARETLGESSQREQGLRERAEEDARAARESADRLVRELQQRLDEREPLAASAADLRGRLEESARELEALRAAARQAAADRERLEREAAEAARSAGEVSAERDRLRESLRQREESLAAEARLWRERAEAAAAREADAQGRLEAAQERARSIEERLGGESEREARGEELVRGELRRIQELLEEVVGRARKDAVDHARIEADLGARLQAALENRHQMLERVERSLTEAAERERRSAVLLQSAIERNPAAPRERANLPAVVPPEPRPRFSRKTVWLAGFAAATLVVGLAVAGLRRAAPPVVPDPGPPVSLPAGKPAGPAEVWDRWTRSDGSGGVLVQATLRSEQELRAEVEAERSSRGWSETESRAQLERRLSDYQFASAYYVTVYLKNLAPGYPAYLDDLAGRFRLRSGAGRETAAFIPPGHEKSRRVFSFGAGPATERIYEATVTLGFTRSALEPSPSYVQLVAADIGSTSRRVLTWELE